MPNALRPSGAKATVSLSGRFHHARVRLTIIYVVILATILCVSSYVIYTNFSSQVHYRFQGMPGDGDGDEFNPAQPYTLQNGKVVFPPTPEQVQEDLIRTLLMVNGLLLVIAAIFSYWLAGVSLEPIQEAYNRQRQFLGDASHELRTPLTILKTDLENELQANKSKGALRERAESHLEEVERMSHLVSDLLSLSRLDEQSQALVAKSPWPVQATIQEAVTRLQPIAKQHQVDLRYVHEQDKKIELLIDKELFLQALSNLIKNGILYNKEGGSVTVSLELERSRVKIVVADTGIGIAKEDLDKIFERFYRVDKSRSRQSGGSGLGLAIVQSAVSSLAGSVEILSQVEKGTTVSISFPLHTSS